MPEIILGQSLFLIMWGAWCKKGGFFSQECDTALSDFYDFI